MQARLGRPTVHDRSYMQSRLYEELARARRYSRPFSLIVLQALPSTDGLPVGQKLMAALDTIADSVRPSDVIARLYDDTILLLLVETDARNARDALQRVGGRVARLAGRWQVRQLSFPEHAQKIEALSLQSGAEEDQWMDVGA